MKPGINIGLLLFPLFSSFAASAQTSIRIAPSMYSVEEISLSQLDGWLFRLGKDSTWDSTHQTEIGWMRLKPNEINERMADDDGRVEGWFRLKMSLDSSFEKLPVGIRVYTWAAMDLYLDGRLISSLGNTGLLGGAFQEHRQTSWDAIPIALQPGKDYTLSIHFVDFKSWLVFNHLKSTFSTQLLLSGPGYHQFSTDYNLTISVYTTIWISVCSVLSLLFWLLAVLNPSEKNLKLIASCVTCSAGGELLVVYPASTPASFISTAVMGYLSILLWTGLFVLIPIIVVTTLNQKITKGLIAILLIVSLLGLANIFVPVAPVLAVILVLILVCSYYLFKSWKSLWGAQWAIVGGLATTIAWMIIFFIGFLHYQRVFYPGSFLYQTGLYLSFPLSLVIYLAMRFKENAAAIETNAKRVIQLSEEKEQQAIMQQKVLEDEVARQTIELRTSLENLKSTQSQLIQSEKMASLGELTAGIAHEIQNPLNFVNNFSEVNKELITEMNEEITKGNFAEAKALATNVTENLEKINHHGKRADSIVKGMLQHSRSSTGQKEPTDINALCDEYLRLAYHGLRAKDKSFNAKFETSFDSGLPKINVAPQDLGRVILNLINNAFYAVTQKKKSSDAEFEPRVFIQTKFYENKIEIIVKDNGVGVPPKAIDKIFQPFFTTKPAGEGTGLGLSIAYDIVTKGHGGTLTMSAQENGGSIFQVSIPIL